MNCTAGRSSVPILVTKENGRSTSIQLLAQPRQALMCQLTILQRHGTLVAVDGVDSPAVPQLSPRSQRDFHPIRRTDDDELGSLRYIELAQDPNSPDELLSHDGRIVTLFEVEMRGRSIQSRPVGTVPHSIPTL